MYTCSECRASESHSGRKEFLLAVLYSGSRQERLAEESPVKVVYTITKLLGRSAASLPASSQTIVLTAILSNGRKVTNPERIIVFRPLEWAGFKEI